jgi:uncharacterized cupin superfamily protein
MITVSAATPEQLIQAKQWEVWEKEPSEFDWDYTQKEIFYILEGAAKVTNPMGEAVALNAGDLVTIEKGGIVHWEITAHIRKHFLFC